MVAKYNCLIRVHTDGIVSSQYLSICREHKCAILDECVVGTKLGVTKDYFNSAFECIYEIGIKLTQVIWRRLDKTDLEPSGNDLVNLSVSLIENRHYNIAIRVLEFFTGKEVRHDQESTRRTHVINLAQSYKWSKRDEDCSRLLNSYDWSGWDDKFRLAVLVLNEEWDNVFDCMSRLAHDKKFNKNFYREWPLFKELRKRKEFPDIYEKCYDEKFPSRESIPKDKEIEQSDSLNPLSTALLEDE